MVKMYLYVKVAHAKARSEGRCGLDTFKCNQNSQPCFIAQITLLVFKTFLSLAECH